MKKIIVMAFSMILAAGVAHSAVTVFSGNDAGGTSVGPNSLAARTAFDAAANPTTFIDFENLALQTFVASPTTPTAVAPGVTAVYGGSVDPGASNVFGVSNGVSVTLGFNTTSGGSKYLGFVPASNPATTPFLTFTYNGPINAWGAYFTGLEPDIPGIVHVVFNDGTSQDISVPDGSIGGGVGFWGFVSTGSPISSITLQELDVGSIRDIWGIDDVVSAQVPEPAGMLLLGLGLAGLAAVRKFRR
jgi:hypothetical protein